MKKYNVIVEDLWGRIESDIIATYDTRSEAQEDCDVRNNCVGHNIRLEFYVKPVVQQEATTCQTR